LKNYLKTHDRHKTIYNKVDSVSFELSVPYDTIEVNQIDQALKVIPKKVGINYFGGKYFYPHGSKYKEYP